MLPILRPLPLSLVPLLALLAFATGCHPDDSGEPLGSNGGEIINGTKDPSGKDARFPQVAGIYATGGGQFGKRFFLCSGTLITPQVVLTAAHCLESVGGDVTAYCNSYTYRQSKNPNTPKDFPRADLTVSFPPDGKADTAPYDESQNVSGIEYGVDGIAWHPDYWKADALTCCQGVVAGCAACDENKAQPSAQHDVALLHLDRPVAEADSAKLGFVARIGALNVAKHTYPIEPTSWPGKVIATLVGVSTTSGGDSGRVYGRTAVINPKILAGEPSLCHPNDPKKLVASESVKCPSGQCTLTVSGEKSDLLPNFGACVAGGDSGGPLVVNHTGLDMSGVTPTPIAGLPAGQPFVVGVLRSAGNVCKQFYIPTWDFVGEGGLKGDYGNGSFILERIEDFDNDSVPDDKDNCPVAPNTDQANCNQDAEDARGYPRRGNACDPIPCPDVTLQAGFKAVVSASSFSPSSG